METHDPTPPATPDSSRGRPNFRADWCRCKRRRPDPVFLPDFVCPCGIDKHHYHCPA
jgi:hypothetical protein